MTNEPTSAHPAPSGESERLEERLRNPGTEWESSPLAEPWVAVRTETLHEAADELSRLRAEVARLAAGWEAEVHRAGELRAALDEAGVAVQRVNGRLVALPTRTTARLIAAEAEAARYREALYRIACGAMPWTREEMIDHAVAVLTTEGGDRE